jgi:hypothetical protein
MAEALSLARLTSSALPGAVKRIGRIRNEVGNYIRVRGIWNCAAPGLPSDTVYVEVFGQKGQLRTDDDMDLNANPPDRFDVYLGGHRWKFGHPTIVVRFYMARSFAEGQLTYVEPWGNTP